MLDKFIARENIRHFTNQLGFESRPRARTVLQKLLLEEEDKLGADLELLGEMKKTIKNFTALIETQNRFVAVLENSRQDSASARALLDGLEQSKIVCERYYERIAILAKQHDGAAT